MRPAPSTSSAGPQPRFDLRKPRHGRLTWLSLAVIGLLAGLAWAPWPGGQVSAGQGYPYPYASLTPFEPNEAPIVPVVAAQAPTAASPAAPNVNESLNSASESLFSKLLDPKWIISTLLAVGSAIIAVLGILNKKFISLEEAIRKNDQLTIENAKLAAAAGSKAELAQEFSRSAKTKAEEAEQRADSAHRLGETNQAAIHKRRKQHKRLESRVNELDSRTQSLMRPLMRQRATEQIPMDDIYEASESGEITRDELVEEEQLRYWRKWIYSGNHLGHDELLESANHPGGLTPPLRYMAREELLRLKELERKEKGLSPELRKRQEELAGLLRAK